MFVGEVITEEVITDLRDEVRIPLAKKYGVFMFMDGYGRYRIQAIGRDEYWTMNESQAASYYNETNPVNWSKQKYLK